MTTLPVDRNIVVLKRFTDRHHILQKGRTIRSGDAAAPETDADEVHAHV